MVGHNQSIRLSTLPGSADPAGSSDSTRGGLCLFERASRRWWDPCFDSQVLEQQYRCTTRPRIRRRLQMCLMFGTGAVLAWLLYMCMAIARIESQSHKVLQWNWLLAGTFIVVPLIMLMVLVAISGNQCIRTCFRQQMVHYRTVGVVAATVLCSSSLLAAAWRLALPEQLVITELQVSAAAVITLLLLYTLTPLALYMAVLVASVYSLLLELMVATASSFAFGYMFVTRLSLHLCVHVLGLRVLILAQSHMRSTFTTVGHTLLTQQQLEHEKRLKEQMIHSVMPPTLASWVKDELREETAKRISESVLDGPAGPSSSRPCPSGPHISFRPFNMQPMDHVSILFADIVGFTRMSSNKSAERLVGLLNDLFGRFDRLCGQMGCEKISTLGDCYYCVSGCPQPRPDHAHCCVRLGLSMVTAIGQFDRDNQQQVDMRVGVHTGRVLCGLVGTKRFKFDVWSNDVTTANRMESMGRPGFVHISEKTLEYLDDDYLVQPGDMVQGLRTYFIVGERVGKPVLREPCRIERLTANTSPIPSVIESAAEPGVPHAAVQRSFSYMRRYPAVVVKKAMSLPNFSRLPPAFQGEVTDWRTDLLGHVHGPTEATSSVIYTNDGKMRWISGKKENHTIRLLPSLHEEEAAQTDIKVVDGGSEGDDLSLQGSDAAASLVSDHSRRDSGIRSRRSSIQAQIATLSGLRVEEQNETRKLSDCYSSSHSSLTPESPVPVHTKVKGAKHLPVNQQVQLMRQVSTQRKLSDLQMIRCVRHMSTQSNYFLNPPVHPLTLNYRDTEFERHYRRHQTRLHHGAHNTISLPEYNMVIDGAVTCLLLVVLTLALLSSSTAALSHWLPPAILCLAALCSLQLLLVLRAAGGQQQLLSRLLERATSWKVFHVLGAATIAAPAAVVLAACSGDTDPHGSTYWLVLFVAVAHFSNFTQLNCWLKSCLAAVASVCGGVLSSSWETGGALFLLTILITALNHEFETSYRLGFCVNLVAARDKAHVQSLKNQADWLLNNIIPSHVAEAIKSHASYSCNHSSVGVLFASIVNFNDLYDESYRGGREYLRVLNEIIGDMDDLLQQYPSVEKIKTIGSTYMAASGLSSFSESGAVSSDSSSCDHHLCQLILFGDALRRAVDVFNASLFEFELKLRVGVHVGDVTAGVIGTTKLYYDIWGDTVNVASRMDSTGAVGKIHTTEQCRHLVSDCFDFEHRGTTTVKGKGQMTTYFVGAPRKQHRSEQ